MAKITFLQDVPAVALLFEEILTELDHLGRAASGNSEQKLFVLLMSGGLATNGIRFHLREEISAVKGDCDTLGADGVVKALKGVL